MGNAQKIAPLISVLAALVAKTPEQAHGPIIATVRAKIAEALRSRGDMADDQIEALADHLTARFEVQTALAACRPVGNA
jgi:hypothetical protein